MADWLASLGFVLNPDGSYTRMPVIDQHVPLVEANPEPEDGVSSRDFVLDSARDLWVRLYHPTVHLDKNNKASLPVIVFYHGGGFILFNAAGAQFHSLCHQISKQLRVIVVSVNYRLAPEHRLPAAYEDGFDALQWLANTLKDDPAAASFGFDKSRIFVMGDSAGGNLAHHVAVRAAREHETLGFKLAGQILVQPFFGGVSRTDSEVRLATCGEVLTTPVCDLFWEMALPRGADMDHEFCNVCLNVQGVLEECKSGFAAKTLVVVGCKDLLSDRQFEYAKIVEQVGMDVKVVVYDDADHAFYVMPGSKFTPLLLDDIGRFCAQSH